MSGDFLGYIAALDIGTTNLRCQIFDQQAKCVGSDFAKIRLLYPDSGLVEIDPEQLWIDVIGVIKNAIKDANITTKSLKSLGIATQRATFITWRKDNGKPLHNFITWKDLRAADLIEEVNRSWRMFALRKLSFWGYFFTHIAKLRIVSNLKFTSSHVTIRLLWLLRNNSEVQKAVADDTLMFGTVDTWLLYKLTKGKTYVSDITNASATGLYDPFNLDWSFIPKYFNIPIGILPQVVNNDYDFGDTDPGIFGVSIKIRAVMADQSASMYGSCSFENDDIKVTLGTGAFLNINTGQNIRSTGQGMYPLVGWKTRDELIYLTEVACSDAGSLIQWMLSIGLITSPQDLDNTPNQVGNNGGVYFVPAFSGLGPPINDESAATGFIGIKSNTTREHMIRAVMESIVYRTVLAYDLLSEECLDNKPEYIRVDGGVSRSNFVCQLLANLTNSTVKRMNSEMASLGVAFLAGQSCGFWTSKADISALMKSEDTFEPTTDDTLTTSNRLGLKKWIEAANRFKSWYQ